MDLDRPLRNRKPQTRAIGIMRPGAAKRQEHLRKHAARDTRPMGPDPTIILALRAIGERLDRLEQAARVDRLNRRGQDARHRELLDQAQDHGPTALNSGGPA